MCYGCIILEKYKNIPHKVLLNFLKIIENGLAHSSFILC